MRRILVIGNGMASVRFVEELLRGAPGVDRHGVEPGRRQGRVGACAQHAQVRRIQVVGLAKHG